MIWGEILAGLIASAMLYITINMDKFMTRKGD